MTQAPLEAVVKAGDLVPPLATQPVTSPGSSTAMFFIVVDLRF